MTCLDTVPAYYRKHFNHRPGDIAMLKLHQHNPAAVRPEHASTAWIAHNAAMKDKRDILLGKGQPPAIGALYRPGIEIKPAVTITDDYWKREVTIGEKVRSVSMLIAFVVVMAGIAFSGGAAGF